MEQMTIWRWRSLNKSKTGFCRIETKPKRGRGRIAFWDRALLLLKHRKEGKKRGEVPF